MGALGMDRTDVGRLFKIEAGLIGLAGGTVGVIAAYEIGKALNPLIVQWLVLDPGVDLRNSYSFWYGWRDSGTNRDIGSGWLVSGT